jgi:DNA replication and repair protein RecF
VHLRRLVARGYRNLADLDLEAPSRGFVLLGANAQGKTNLLEAIYYPVLFRSFRGAADGQVAGSPSGFSVEVHVGEGPAASVAATYSGRKKRITIDGAEVDRLADSVGNWLAVAFLPADVGLASGPAAERRQYLDRVLSLSDRRYLRALTSYRGALAQRNSALRQSQIDVAQAFNGALATAGAALVRWRLDWVAGAAEQFATELESLGEQGEACLRYRGRLELADTAGWEAVLAESLLEDRARSMTTAGPHRDDLVLEVNGRRLRDYGSTGQQRSAAIALKLIEITSLRRARGTEPVLLLDDVFAELDGDRQRRLGARLLESDGRQVFITSPRRDELPANLDLPVWIVEGGRISSD